MLSPEPLAVRLAEIGARYPAAQPEMVAEVVQSVLATMRGSLTATEAVLLAEVEALAGTIATARAEVAALAMDDITASHIPHAADELDAIVAHTAQATDAILEGCETLDRLGDALSGEAAAQLQAVTTRIYEACGFQDLTGQRITKVVAALQAIDAKVAGIIAAFGGRRGVAPTPAVAPRPAVLENGPQLPHNAMDQSDIDKLLASFD
jgi:chemotaxis protein CheZ